MEDFDGMIFLEETLIPLRFFWNYFQNLGDCIIYAKLPIWNEKVVSYLHGLFLNKYFHEIAFCMIFTNNHKSLHAYVHVGRRSEDLTHLQLVDDTILFSFTRWEEVVVFKRFVRCS